MKVKHIFTVLFFSICLISFQSCDNEPLEGEFVNDGGSGNANQEQGSFQVDFDGQTYVADVTSATVIDNTINVSGFRGSNQELITITIFGSTEGTYPLGVTTNNVEANGAAYSPQNGGNVVWVSVDINSTAPQGEVTISEINTSNMTISGTFYFTGYDTSGNTKEFTNGSFSNVPYGGLQNNNDNTFFAKVDGNEFEEDLVEGFELSLAGMSNIAISATKNSGETIGFFFDGDIAPGSYNFNGFGSLSNIAQYNLGSTLIHIGDGTFVITSHDTANNRIIGTFEFMANPSTGSTSTQTYSITEGSFDVTYN